MSKTIYASSHESCRMKERIGNIKNDKTHLRNIIQNGKKVFLKNTIKSIIASFYVI